MKIMIVGGGGREHAIIKKLLENPDITRIYALPGNGGIARDAVCIPIAARDVAAVAAFAREEAIGFAVITPEDPLALGAVDALEASGVPCFGPNAKAAVIESSKAFSKNLMRKYGIPTAAYEIFTELGAALSYVDSCAIPIVIKADGLALGKGVTVAASRGEARDAVRALMERRVFGESGARVVIEEFLTGPEVTVLAFTDGENLAPMVSAMDHKRALDGGAGPNTGGMGAVAPNPFYTRDIARICMDSIFLTTIRAMRSEGRPFRGCLYFGLMLTPEGPRVIEYNCRFGDPETQAVLPLLTGDLFAIMRSVSAGRLREDQVSFSRRASCCVVLASKGYPGAYETGSALRLPPAGPDRFLFVAGARQTPDGLVSDGGRVLGATAVADTLREAIGGAYSLADSVGFPNGYCRRDIGERALKACVGS